MFELVPLKLLAFAIFPGTGEVLALEMLLFDPAESVIVVPESSNFQ